MDFRIEIFIFKLVYTEKVLLFGPFGRELLCFEYLDISLDLTGICCRSEKISLICVFVVVYFHRVAVFLIF